ncbi:LacI family DNA-binding transcriptional regulator [Fictibacillus sp. FJAT-27399]|uniref:LacI family DNA-binding transcriptional regulator n=1 Tax=Fictibacillus sp. FJAT-27399 TaxID=1729689 RepID=UPI0007807EC9|nr:LacI family DNA-binding transcriptional regulator [Fictibacillus sp. FJAT-27399]
MVSSKDVAKIAGVSQSTVSRVLNNPESVKPATRNVVLHAMKDLSYQPNLIARSLVTNSTRTLALITGTLYNGFYVETTTSIVNLATSRGFKTMVYFEEAMPFRDVIDTIRGNKLEGVLMSSIKLEDPIFHEIENSGIPYMLFNRRPKSGGNYVVLDNILAGEIITQHILELGHKRIAYISGGIHVSTHYERKLGFESVMNREEIPIHPGLFHIVDTKPDDIEKVTLKLMHMSERPTAIICGSTAIAFSCMDAILSMGLRIPEDISLAGMDNVGMASHHAIQLTTVGNSKFKMGEIAADNLFDMIEQRETVSQPRQIVLQPELIIRKTTGLNRVREF